MGAIKAPTSNATAIKVVFAVVFLFFMVFSLKSVPVVCEIPLFRRVLSGGKRKDQRGVGSSSTRM